MNIREESQCEQTEARIQQATDRYYQSMDGLDRDHNNSVRKWQRRDRAFNVLLWAFAVIGMSLVLAAIILSLVKVQ